MNGIFILNILHVLNNVQVLSWVIVLDFVALHILDILLNLQNLIKPRFAVDSIESTVDITVVLTNDRNEQVETNDIDDERAQNVWDPSLAVHVTTFWILTEHLLIVDLKDRNEIFIFIWFNCAIC